MHARPPQPPDRHSRAGCLHEASSHAGATEVGVARRLVLAGPVAAAPAGSLSLIIAVRGAAALTPPAAMSLGCHNQQQQEGRREEQRVGGARHGFVAGWRGRGAAGERVQGRRESPWGASQAGDGQLLPAGELGRKKELFPPGNPWFLMGWHAHAHLGPPPGPPWTPTDNDGTAKQWAGRKPAGSTLQVGQGATAAGWWPLVVAPATSSPTSCLAALLPPCLLCCRTEQQFTTFKEASTQGADVSVGGPRAAPPAGQSLRPGGSGAACRLACRLVLRPVRALAGVVAIVHLPAEQDAAATGRHGVCIRSEQCQGAECGSPRVMRRCSRRQPRQAARRIRLACTPRSGAG